MMRQRGMFLLLTACIFSTACASRALKSKNSKLSSSRSDLHHHRDIKWTQDRIDRPDSQLQTSTHTGNAAGRYDYDLVTGSDDHEQRADDDDYDYDYGSKAMDQSDDYGYNALKRLEQEMNDADDHHAMDDATSSAHKDKDNETSLHQSQSLTDLIIELSSPTCARKLPHCATCMPDYKSCAVCQPGYMLQPGSNLCINAAPCEYGCKRCGADGRCRACFERYALVNGACATCRDLHPGCKSCDSNHICVSCTTGHLLIEGSCLPQTDIDPHCVVFHSSGACEECELGWTPENSRCVRPLFELTLPEGLDRTVAVGTSIPVGTSGVVWDNMVLGSIDGLLVAANNPQGLNISTLVVDADSMTDSHFYYIPFSAVSFQFVSDGPEYTVTCHAYRHEELVGTHTMIVSPRPGDTGYQRLREFEVPSSFENIVSLKFTVSPPDAQFKLYQMLATTVNQLVLPDWNPYQPGKRTPAYRP